MMLDPGTAKLVEQAEEAQAMLRQTLNKLADTQGQLQACEEIIKRTRQVVEDFRGKDQISNLAGSALLKALGPVQQ